jgi:hypothetical protein
MMTGRTAGVAAGAAGVALLAAFAGWSWVSGGTLKLWAEGVRGVDFANAAIDVSNTACADPLLSQAGIASLPMHDGAYHLGAYRFELASGPKYGNVSGNTSAEQSEKAVFVGSCNSGAQPTQVLFVYGLENGHPARIASVDLPGGESSSIQSLDVNDGTIEVRQIQGAPPTLSVLTYALLNGTLASLGPAGGNGSTETAQEGGAENSVADDLAAGSDRVSYQYFKDQLSPYGNWVNHPRWGAVWRPNDATRADFRPYQDGHWENSQEYGTVWVSDQSWGDIPFHYGRWAYDRSYGGWLWVPGYTWGPGWVEWRAGDNDIGWFPMPPGDDYTGEAAYVDHWNDWYGYHTWYGAGFDPDLYYSFWTFVPAVDIFFPSIGRYAIDRRSYARFIGRTRPWTHYAEFRGHIVNRSIDPARFRAEFKHPLPVMSHHDFDHHPRLITTVDAGHKIEAREMSARKPEGPREEPRAMSASRPTNAIGHERPVQAEVREPRSPSGRAEENPFRASSHAEAARSPAAREPEEHSFSSNGGFGPSGSKNEEPSRSGFSSESTHSSGFGGRDTEHASSGSSHSGFGGSESGHSSFGGGAEHQPFGGGSSHPAFGGSDSGHPAFGGGAPAQQGPREAPVNGAAPRPSAPPPSHPSSSSPHH